jgi:hypothetical protein
MTFDPAMFQHAPALLAKVRAEQARRSLKAYWQQAWPIVEPGTPLTCGDGPWMPSWSIWRR